MRNFDRLIRVKMSDNRPVQLARPAAIRAIAVRILRFPVLCRFLPILRVYLEHTTITEDELATVLRAYRKDPRLVRLLLKIYNRTRERSRAPSPYD